MSHYFLNVRIYVLNLFFTEVFQHEIGTKKEKGVTCRREPTKSKEETNCLQTDTLSTLSKKRKKKVLKFNT